MARSSITLTIFFSKSSSPVNGKSAFHVFGYVSLGVRSRGLSRIQSENPLKVVLSFMARPLTVVECGSATVCW